METHRRRQHREDSSKSMMTTKIDSECDFAPVLLSQQWRVLAKPLIWLNNQFVDHGDSKRLLGHCALATFSIFMLSRTVSNLPAIIMLVYAVWHLILAYATIPDDGNQTFDVKLGNTAAAQLNQVHEGVAVVRTNLAEIYTHLCSNRQTHRTRFYLQCGVFLLTLYKLVGYISASSVIIVATTAWLHHMSGVKLT
eukprot:m.112298 g.112298  ORF g.112298 m.112298 type:complete len:195 (-) comp28182_c2_seq3:181-765(-)